MTEDLGSDQHRRSPSNAELDIVKLKERHAALAEDYRETKEVIRENTKTSIAQNDIIIGKLSNIEKGLALGEQRFAHIEKSQRDTTDAMTAVDARITALVARVDVAEKNRPGVFGSIVGSLGFIGTGLWWGLHLLSKGAVPPPPGDK